MKPLIRLYGSQNGWGSSEVVFDGMHEGLSKNGQLAGTFIYNRDDDEDALLDGVDAPVCIACPPPRNIHIMGAFGHKQRWFILAPNSTKVPPTFIDLISQHTDGIITPSQFGADSLRNSEYKGLLKVVSHGISEDLKSYVSEEDSDWLHETVLFKAMRRDCLSFLHTAESSMDRKGTWPLVQAFVGWRYCGDSHLTIVLSHREMDVLASQIEDAFGAKKPEDLNITIMGRVNLPPNAIGAFYSCFDVVCQPSRSEGFGLVPLEALACGIPVMITISTGHMQWCENSQKQLRPGIFPVMPGLMQPARFDGDGMAPTVDPEAIRASLDEVMRTYSSKRAEACVGINHIRNEFTWEKVTKEFCADIEKEFA